MILSNLGANDTLALSCDGETKVVGMLTDTSVVPYTAYYTMPNGYVAWLTITLAGNIFTISAGNNLFSETARTVTIQFCCVPTAGGTLQTKNVVVTQAADTVSVVFDPTTVSLAYNTGATDTIALTGVPTGATVNIVAPTWLQATMESDDELIVTAELNTADASRSGSVSLTVNGRTFYLAVTQAANTASLTFSPTTVSLACGAASSDDVTVTGIPGGASVAFDLPAWLSATVLSGVVTITATENTSADARAYSVGVTVEGKTFYIPVSQAAAEYLFGPLTLNETSHAVAFEGATFTVSAENMPSNADTLSCVAKAAGSCTACGETKDIVSFERLTPTSFSVTVQPQDIFDGVERAFVLSFTAGNEIAAYTITQAAPTAMFRFFGAGDKFVRSALSPLLPTYLLTSTLQNMLSDLKTTGWVQLTATRPPLLVGVNRDSIPVKIQFLEAFKECYGRSTVDETLCQHVGLGAAVYKFAFEPAAYGLVLRGIRFTVRSDSFCVDGLRVALETTNTTESPANDWPTIREGTGGNYKSARAMRVLKESDGLYYGVSEVILFDGLNITLSSSTRLYLYLTLEDYRSVSNGWAYGSGIIVPSFDFYSEALHGSLADYDTIALSTVSKEVYVLSTGGDIVSPQAAETENGTDTTRELAMQSATFGQSVVKDDPDPITASPFLAFLATRLAQFGMSAIDISTNVFRRWPQKQIGLTCSVCRRVVGDIIPYEHRLDQIVSVISIACAFPVTYAPTLLRLTHRVGEPTLTVSGADIRLSVYWVPSKMLTLAQLAPFFAEPEFLTGGAQLSIDGVTATRIGTEKMPASVSAGGEVLLRISTPSTRWGTLLIIPWMIRVTATELTTNVPVGLVGANLEGNEIVNTGWMPDIQAEE